MYGFTKEDVKRAIKLLNIEKYFKKENKKLKEELENLIFEKLWKDNNGYCFAKNDDEVVAESVVCSGRIIYNLNSIFQNINEDNYFNNLEKDYNNDKEETIKILFSFREDMNTKPASGTIDLISEQSQVEKIIVECLLKNNIEIDDIVSSFNSNNIINGKQNIVSLLYYLGGLSIDIEKSNNEKFSLKIPNEIAKEEIIEEIQNIYNFEKSDITKIKKIINEFIIEQNIGYLEELFSIIVNIRFSNLNSKDDLKHHLKNSMQETFLMCFIFSGIQIETQIDNNSDNQFLDFTINGKKNNKILISFKNIALGYVWNKDCKNENFKTNKFEDWVTLKKKI
jgi:hypothetical protein